MQVFGLTLTDVELTQWLVDLRHDAASASMAAAKVTGDQHSLEMLATGADVKRRRAEWLTSRANLRSTCAWCDAIGSLCEDCRKKTTAEGSAR